jgi:hypothetical protein
MWTKMSIKTQEFAIFSLLTFLKPYQFHSSIAYFVAHKIS